ncbi:hypothetical protein LG3211_0790 [Lysobacter gummosus]|nr:hypothetical protein LG3211_0790 [Lysobacter gummosus]
MAGLEIDKRPGIIGSAAAQSAGQVSFNVQGARPFRTASPSRLWWRSAMRARRYL